MRDKEMIKKFFQDFCTNMEIDKEYVEEINRHKKVIVSCIDKKFGSQLATAKSQFIGSYGRNTAVYTENIRLLVSLPEEMYWQLSLEIQDILLKMKNALIAEYGTCEYSDNGNGLNININGYLSYEIVPGFVFDKGEYIYLCDRKWRKLNLKVERENFFQLNEKVNGNLVQLCRILKVWKNYHEVEISNILLDTYAYHFFYINVDEKRYSFDNYDKMLLDFFGYLMQNCKKETFISFDGETVLKKKVDLYEKVFLSETTAQTALAVANCNMLEESVEDWKKILGCGMYLNMR